MKLELKHIALYLPYGLKWYHSNRNGTHPITLYNANTIISAVNNQNYKIVLRPMSDLYKERNGEVGIVAIGKMFEPNGALNFEDGNYYYGWNTHVCDDYQGYEIGWIESAGWFGLFFDTYDYDNQTENFTGDYLPYNREVAEYLDDNHFDWRYNLIEQGLAINKNDIE